MRVLVCGGRDYNNKKYVYEILDALHHRVKIDLIIHGGAVGADSLGEEWAIDRKIPFEREKANWNDLTEIPCSIRYSRKHGKYNVLAGINRNQRMIDKYKPDLGVAFPGGSGTQDMIDRLEKHNIKVLNCNIIRNKSENTQ